MAICPKCGQPKHPNGVCYNCARNLNEARRCSRGDPGMGDRRDHWDWVPRCRDQSRHSSIRSIRRRAAGRKSRAAKGEAELPPLDIRFIKYSDELHLGLNQFLADVYGTKRLLSEILSNAGLSDEQIARLRKRHLTTYLPKLIHAWCHEWRKTLSETDIGLLVRYYGLDGKLPSFTGRLHDIASSSSEEVRIHRTALRRLQQPKQRAGIEAVAVREAKHILARSETRQGATRP